jgi:hypothetical protein
MTGFRRSCGTEIHWVYGDAWMASIPNNCCRITDEYFDLGISCGAITSLKRVGDSFPTEYILPGKRLGDVVVRMRALGESDWTAFSTQEAGEGGAYASHAKAADLESTYTLGSDLTCRSCFSLDNNALNWRIIVQNTGTQKVELGDVAVPLRGNDDYVWDAEVTSSMRVFMHSFVSGHGTFVYWLRPNSEPPYLLMTPRDSTACEYWDMSQITGGKEMVTEGYNLYLHSKAQQAVIDRKGGSWRLAHTGRILGPGEAAQYDFAFQWVSSYQEIRDILFLNGQFDVEIVPGMVVPQGLSVRLAVRTDGTAELRPEFLSETEVSFLEPNQDRQIIELRFSRLGENAITLSNRLGKRTTLEFFVTQSAKTMIDKRSAFLTGKSRHRDSSAWWDGLVSDWNMESHTLLGPEHLDRVKGWREYMASCDDPGLGKMPFVALKNIEFPVPDQIAAIDYYIERFVWGGLQMTDAERHPFGIYGIPNWKRNRESTDDGPDGKLHIWRIYDYPHVALLYWAMYKLARLYPNVHMQLEAVEYLRRAGGTAIATFTIPAEVKNWSAYQTGLYNELIYSRLIEDLASEGLVEMADTLRRHWHNKICYFILENPSLYGSEYPFDSTGFESMHEFARYAVEAARREDTDLAVTESQARSFMEKEIGGNIFCRGWLEPAYYILGSDLRANGSKTYTLSYMSQMGGWGLLDFALYHAERPYEYLRLAYASALSSWALMNTGTEESNFGYWYPGPENDGAAGGGFEPAAYGYTWLEQPHGRGSWYYSCEIDLGFSGGLRCACTVLADDPVFGLYCYGGDLETKGDLHRISPRDGVHRRFHMITERVRFHLLLDRDGFDIARGISVSGDLSSVSFSIENRQGGEHESEVRVTGLPAGTYHILLDSITYDTTVQDDETICIQISVKGDSTGASIQRER